MEQNPIEVLEKLIKSHKAEKPQKISDSARAYSNNNPSKEQYGKNTKKQDAPEDWPLKELENTGSDSKESLRIAIRKPSKNEKPPVIVMAGRLRSPATAGQNDENARSSTSDKMDRDKDRRKTCRVCHDKNEWIPLGKNTKYEKNVVDKDASSSKVMSLDEMTNLKKKNESVETKKVDRKESGLIRTTSLQKFESRKSASVKLDELEIGRNIPERTRISTSLSGRQGFTIRKGRPVRLDIQLELKDIGKGPNGVYKRVPRKNLKPKIAVEERSNSNFRFDDFSANQFGPFDGFGIDFDFPKTSFVEVKPKHPKREVLPHAPTHKEPTKTKYKVPKDPSNLYVEDPWKNIDKVTAAAPPYIPQPLHNTGYQPEQFDTGPDIGYKPEPAYKPEPVYKPEPYHNTEVPYKPKPVFHYKKPNYRPPIQAKPILHKQHEIVKTPYHEPKPHHKPQHHPKLESYHRPEPYHKQKPYHKPAPFYKPESYHEPAPYHKPEPYNKPEPYDEPEPYHKPEKYEHFGSFNYEDAPILVSEPHKILRPVQPAGPQDLHTQVFGPDSFPAQPAFTSTPDRDRDGAR